MVRYGVGLMFLGDEETEIKNPEKKKTNDSKFVSISAQGYSTLKVEESSILDPS
jgi:hypothetical protein